MRYVTMGVALAVLLCVVALVITWAISGSWHAAALAAFFAALPSIIAADYLLQSYGMEDDRRPRAD